MGGLLESLWGYNANIALAERNESEIEIAWFPSHQYHDFALVFLGSEWNPETKQGELFRIEAKSMNFDADESKAHFDVLQGDLDEYDALLIIVWNWEELDSQRCYPRIVDSFFDLARPIARLRDELHLARGGSFVDRKECPDKCASNTCTHDGEPLNEKGKRERLSGPDNCRPSTKVSHAANFGGLLRMLKTRGPEAKQVFRRTRRENAIADRYIEFIHRNFPSEERNHYSKEEWRWVARELGINPTNKEKTDLHQQIRTNRSYVEIFQSLNRLP